MKNFLNLLDTKDNIFVKLELHSITKMNVPYVNVSINDRLEYSDYLQDTLTVTGYFDLLMPLCVKVEMLEKQYNQQKETAVVIDSLSIDDFVIIPQYNHLVVYENEKNFSNSTCYLGANGTWNLSVDKPFYQWLHEITGQGWLLTPT